MRPTWRHWLPLPLPNPPRHIILPYNIYCVISTRSPVVTCLITFGFRLDFLYAYLFKIGYCISIVIVYQYPNHSIVNPPEEYVDQPVVNRQVIMVDPMHPMDYVSF